MAAQARTIHVYGYPSAIGGASTELWHTVRTWRRAGLDVSLFTPGPTDPLWRVRLIQIGAKTVAEIPDGALVVGFCNCAFRTDAPDLRARGCKLIYVPCMNWHWPDERIAPCFLFDHYVYQSLYQYHKLFRNRISRGLDSSAGTVIHGAFCADEFPFRPRPHKPGEPFVIGRLSRCVGMPLMQPAFEKYPADLWKQYAMCGDNIQVKVMGWSAEIQNFCGAPPPWAEVYPQGAMESDEFLASIHCLVPGIGCVAENWPRVGLEAMATGVPILTKANGGWPEMLGDTVNMEQLGSPSRLRRAQAEAVKKMAADESYRQSLISIGVKRMEYLTDPAAIVDQWNKVFKEVDG
jgi:glycosyltransferase involved in cell wall biosynthesis